MTFYETPTHYIKTIMSDLQGSWEWLRDEVVKCMPFENASELILHIDEGMSWESVRDLQHMKKTLLVVQNFAKQEKLSNEVYEIIEETMSLLNSAIEQLGK